ncbi:hypothetical protein L9F63_004713 [Diploptera punctata]|uniref:Uncharacterized protein n=1 Tax=Diploptera punctata TaxID=6984 RepID=A0AAD7ZF87_DIPPU|nr:hypothetical protein L9F63_004713 [Diploptera punctata]
MASKKILGESLWKTQVKKEKCAAREWETKYGYLRDEILKVSQDVKAVVEPYVSSQEHRIVVTLPPNEVPVPKQTSQMIGWRSSQQKLIYDKPADDGHHRRKPLDEFMCFCRVGYDCICPGNEGLHSLNQVDENNSNQLS